MSEKKSLHEFIFSREFRLFWIMELVFFLIIVVVNIWPQGFDEYIRWFMIAGVPIYNFVPGLLLIAMGAYILIKDLADEKYNNYIFFSLGTIFLGIFFVWSGYIDLTRSGDGRISPLNGEIIGYTASDWARAYSLNFLLGMVFTLFWFIHFEYSYREDVSTSRLSVLLVTMLPMITIFLNKQVRGDVDFSFNNFEMVMFLLYLLGGLGFFAYISIRRLFEARLEFRSDEIQSALNYQLALLVGVLQALFLFVLTEAGRFLYNELFTPDQPIRTIIHAPLIIVIFITPLFIFYLQNPNFITTLSLPAYEVLIIDIDSGLSIFNTSLREGKHNEIDAMLKSGLLNALSNMFGEIVGIETHLKSVNLEDRSIIVRREKVTGTYDDKSRTATLLVTLVSKRSTQFLRNSVKHFTKLFKEYVSTTGILRPAGFVLNAEDEMNLIKMTQEVFQ